ncbi:MAG: ABC transporter permease [Acidobacteria bacterium]|nr:ABC transporter permease [Acidobacteriota bacterium]
MSGLLQDLRHAVRLLRKTPGFTLAAILTLGLGIGANTAIFTLVEGVFLGPLPYREAERLVSLHDVQAAQADAPASYPEYIDWKGRGEIFESVAACFTLRSILTGAGDPFDASTRFVAGDLLAVLGTRPALGRDFLPEEEVAGGPGAAIVSHALWQSRLSADPAIVGRMVTLDGRAVTIVGVLEAGFRIERDADVWIPLRPTPDMVPRGMHFLNVYARLKDGVDAARARRELETFAAGLRAGGVTDHDVALTPLRARIVGDAGRTLLLLQVAVVAVLLIACANVASLTLARSAARRSEIAVRLALGASRGRIVRQMLTEGLVLAMSGGALGVLLAWWGVDAGVSSGAFAVPGEIRPGIDPAVLAFTLGVSIAAALLFGLVPAWQATGASLQASLAQGGRSDAARRGSLRRALVACEVAISVVLLIGSGLLLRSLWRALEEPIGFDPARVLSLDVHLGDPRYAEPARAAGFVEEARRNIAALPGVESAAAVLTIPLSGGSANGNFGIDGRTFPAGSEPIADKLTATPGYFRTMRIPLLRGRDFDDRDRAGAPGVAIVNEALARQWFRGVDPVGKRIAFNWQTEGYQTIVGVVADTKMSQVEESPRPAIYVPVAQRPDTALTFVVRTASPPAAMARALGETIHALDRNQPVPAPRTMESIVSDSLTPRRAPAALVGAFASVALALAALGIYGLLSFSVAQRTHEIGLRMALGARAADVLRMILREGLSTTLAGVGLGLIAGLALTRLISGMLYGVSSSDPATFAAVAITLTAVALVPAYVPARRATRIDPMAALRNE